MDLQALKTEITTDPAGVGYGRPPEAKDIPAPTVEEVTARKEFEVSKDFRKDIPPEEKGRQGTETEEEAAIRREARVAEKKISRAISEWDAGTAEKINTVIQETEAHRQAMATVATEQVFGAILIDDMRALGDADRAYLASRFPAVVTETMRDSLLTIFNGTPTATAIEALLRPYTSRAMVLFGSNVTPSQVADARRLP